MSIELENPLSQLSDQQANNIIEAVTLSDWTRVKNCVSRLGLSAPQVEHILAWTIRALRRGELQKISIEKPISRLPLISAWRCDVSLPKHLKIHLLWRLRLPNDRYITLQLSPAQFHQVRYNIAVLLKELFALKNNALCQK